MNKQIPILMILTILFSLGVNAFCYDYDSFEYTSWSDMSSQGWGVVSGDSGSTAKINIIDGMLYLNESAGKNGIAVGRPILYGDDQENGAGNLGDANNIMCSSSGDNVTIEFDWYSNNWVASFTSVQEYGLHWTDYTGSQTWPYYFTLVDGATNNYFLGRGGNIDNNKLFTYADNTWYNIKYTYGWDGSSCDTQLYVNDTLVNDNATQGGYVGLATLGFGTGSGIVAGSGGVYVDNLKIYDSDTPLACEDVELEECVYPSVFCDNFNDGSTLSPQWLVYDTDGSQNIAFSDHENGNINWTESDPGTIGYSEIDAFPVEYVTSSSSVTTSSIFAPVMTTTFELNFNGSIETDDELIYSTYDYNGNTCTKMTFDYKSDTQLWINFLNGSEIISTGYSMSGGFENRKFILTHYFSNDGRDYPFNSTIEESYYTISYRNPVTGATSIWVNEALPSDCDNIYSAYFTRYEDTTGWIIDNYYHYVGTDPLIDTNHVYYRDLYDQTDTSTSSADDDDVSVVVDDFWQTVGLKSERSKFMLGLFVLLVTTLATVGVMAKAGHISGGGIAVVDIVMMILLTFMGLMPIWILIVLGIIAAGVGMLVAKQQAQ